MLTMLDYMKAVEEELKRRSLGGPEDYFPPRGDMERAPENMLPEYENKLPPPGEPYYPPRGDFEEGPSPSGADMVSPFSPRIQIDHEGEPDTQKWTDEQWHHWRQETPGAPLTDPYDDTTGPYQSPNQSEQEMLQDDGRVDKGETPLTPLEQMLEDIERMEDTMEGIDDPEARAFMEEKLEERYRHLEEMLNEMGYYRREELEV